MSAEPTPGTRAVWPADALRTQVALAALLAPWPVRLLDAKEGRRRLAAILRHHREADARGYRLTHSVGRWHDLDALLAPLLRAAPALSRWTLLVQQADLRGVYELDNAALQAHASTLLKWDGDTVVFARESLAEGLLVDREARDDGSLRLELEAWSAHGWATTPGRGRRA